MLEEVGAVKFDGFTRPHLQEALKYPHALRHTHALPQPRSTLF